MIRTQQTLLALALGACLAPAAWAQNSSDQGAGAARPQAQQSSQAGGAGQSSSMPSGHPSVIGETITVRGKITDKDASKRTVTLQGKDGKEVTLHVAPNVLDFDRLKQGDQLTARYTEAVAIGLAKAGRGGQGAGGAQGASSSSSAQNAQSSGGAGGQGGQQAQGNAGGGRPVAGEIERMTMVAQVQKIDTANNRVTLRGPRGNTFDVKVQDKQALSNVKQGDQVAVTYIQASALSLQPGGETAGANGGGNQGSSASSQDSGNSPGSSQGSTKSQ